MKKKFLIILIMVMCFFVGINGVKALGYDITNFENYITKNKKNYNFLCGYDITNSNKKYSAMIAINNDDRKLYVIYSQNEKKFKDILITDSDNSGSDVYTKSETLYGLTAKGECPSNAYYDAERAFHESDICFDDSESNYCLNDVKTANFDKTTSSEKKYDFSVDNRAFYDEYTNDSDLQNQDWLAACYYFNLNNSSDMFSIYYNYDQFLLKHNGNTITSTNLDDIDLSIGAYVIYRTIDPSLLSELIISYQTGGDDKNACPQYFYWGHSAPSGAGNIEASGSSHYYSFSLENITVGFYNDQYKRADELSKRYVEITTPTEPEPDPIVEDCSLFGKELISKINKYLSYVKIIVPILIIGLGVVDFARAVLASSEDDMKKAQKAFVTRLIVGVAIFFVPSIVTLLLKLANQVWSIIDPNSCKIG